MTDLPDNTNTDNYLREAALAKDAWPNSIEGSHLP
jgi:hypothetical protein